MKNFKKILAAMLVCVMSFIVIGCTSNSPTKVVSKYFDELKKGEKADVDKLLVQMSEEANTTDSATEDTAEAETEQSPELEKVMSDLLKKLEYKVNSETVDGEKAIVNVTVTGANFGQAFMATLGEMFTTLMGQAFSGKEMTEEESNAFADATLIKHLNAATMEERTGDVNLTKVDGNWQIEVDDSLYALLLGNFAPLISGEGATEGDTTSKTEDVPQEDIVIVDNEVVKVTVTGKATDLFGATYKVLIENKSDKKIMVQTRDISVDGMMSEPMFSVEITAGKKAKGDMSFTDIEKAEDLKNVEGKLIVMDENYNEIGNYDIAIK